MRSVLALPLVAALAGFAAAQINLDDINLDDINLGDIPDDIRSLVPSGILDNVPSEIATLLPSGLQQAPSPTSTDADSNTLPGLVDQLPRCAVDCLQNAAQQINCGATDFACLCNNASALGENMLSCILSGSNDCGLGDAADAGRVAPQICNRVNSNPSSEEIASASRMVDNAIETGTGTSDSDNGASAMRVGAGLFGAAFLVALGL